MVNWSNGMSLVEGVDDPVAVLPDGARGVDAVAVGVGVAGQVEPVPAPALAVVRRRQQAIHQALVGVGPRVGDEVVDLLRRRRQAEQVEADSRRISVTRSASGDGAMPSFSSRARMKRSIGLRTQASILDGRRGGPHRRLERPVLARARRSAATSPAGALAPASIQARSMAICAGVSAAPWAAWASRRRRR